MSQRTRLEVNIVNLANKMVIVWNRLTLEVEAGKDILLDYCLNTDTNRPEEVKEYSEPGDWGRN